MMENDKINLAKLKLIKIEEEKKREEERIKLAKDKAKEEQKKEALKIEKEKQERPRIDFEKKIQHYIKNLEDIIVEEAEKGKVLEIELLTLCRGTYTLNGGDVRFYESEEPTVDEVYDRINDRYRTFTHMEKKTYKSDTTYKKNKSFCTLVDGYNPFDTSILGECYNGLTSDKFYEEIKPKIKNIFLKELCTILEKKDIYPNFTFKDYKECHSVYSNPYIDKKNSESITNYKASKRRIILEVDARISNNEKKIQAEIKRKKIKTRAEEIKVIKRKKLIKDYMYEYGFSTLGIIIALVIGLVIGKYHNLYDGVLEGIYFSAAILVVLFSLSVGGSVSLYAMLVILLTLIDGIYILFF